MHIGGNITPGRFFVALLIPVWVGMIMLNIYANLSSTWVKGSIQPVETIPLSSKVLVKYEVKYGPDLHHFNEEVQSSKQRTALENANDLLKSGSRVVWVNEQDPTDYLSEEPGEMLHIQIVGIVLLSLMFFVIVRPLFRKKSKV